jgi:hypothetical protein
MTPGLARRLWREDRAALVVLAVGSVVAAIGWRGTTRPMVDTLSYQSASRVITDGWGSLTDRTPGYPLLLWATGSQDGSTRVLFVVQLLLHASTVLLVVDLARRHGVGMRGRTVLAALLVAPPVMLRVVYEGTEGLSAWFVTVIAWLLLSTDSARRPVARALAVGVACGGATLVRPTFSLIWVPVAVLVAWPHGRRAGLRVGLAVAAPALLVAVGLTAYNGARFDSWGLTPLAPYHLSSRTSAYVEDLPDRYEPARSVLIAERDRALLRGEEVAPTNFIFRARPELQRVTGKQGPELDRYVLEMDLWLIAHHPFDYLDAVLRACVNYVPVDSQGAILGWGRPAAWAMAATHLGLLALFAAVAAVVPGLALAGRVSRRDRRLLVVGALLSLYVAAVSTMVENGTARLRAPTEPLLALLLVLGVSLVRRAWVHRPRPGAGDPVPGATLEGAEAGVEAGATPA